MNAASGGNRKRLAMLVCLRCAAALAGAEASIEERLKEQQAAPTRVMQNGNWVVVPIPVANPTVGTGLEAAVLYLHPKKPGEENAPATTSGAGAMWTDSESWMVGAFHDGSFANDRYRLNAFAGVGTFNLTFYGIGNASPSDRQIPYRFDGGAAQLRGETRVGNTQHWFVGLTYLLIKTRVTFQTSQAMPDVTDPAGDFGVAGLGPQLAYDSRDNNYFPLSGQYLRASWLNFAPAWGGDFTYDTLDVFYNYYTPLAPRAVLALRARLQSASDGAPFFDLPTLDMRGFARDRYRDNHTLSLIAEGRYMFEPRWGAVAYVEAGRYASTVSTLADSPTITTYGGGLRWQVTADRNMNLGLDYAVSTDDSAVFIQVGERF